LTQLPFCPTQLRVRDQGPFINVEPRGVRVIFYTPLKQEDGEGKNEVFEIHAQQQRKKIHFILVN
jgi:hypothetical protein